jgi:hypothetical protein
MLNKFFVDQNSISIIVGLAEVVVVAISMVIKISKNDGGFWEMSPNDLRYLISFKNKKGIWLRVTSPQNTDVK